MAAQKQETKQESGEQQPQQGQQPQEAPAKSPKVTNLTRHNINASGVFIPRGESVALDATDLNNTRAMAKLKAAATKGQVALSGV